VNPHLSFWLTTLPEVPAAMIASALDYLFEHGRGAVLPDVRHRIQISRHYPNMSEVRVPHAWARRKSSDWYDVFVPIADAVTDLYLQEHP
jgi:hypothetical protein